MYKVGIVGDKDSVLGFMALGIGVFPAENPEEIKKTVLHLVEEKYAVIYITEKAYLQAQDTVERYQSQQLPAIIVVPGMGEKLGLGMNAMRESSKRATGMDLLFNN